MSDIDDIRLEKRFFSRFRMFMYLPHDQLSDACLNAMFPVHNQMLRTKGADINQKPQGLGYIFEKALKFCSPPELS